MLVALLAALTLGQTPQHRLFQQPNLPRVGLAFFEFAPSGGQGIGSACACTTPTGAKGEAMTFTRASSGTCLKAGTTLAIANGDLVTCTSNQPRVMPGGAGTGPLGLLVEVSRTNDLLRSEELNNAAWADSVFGVAAPTITADQAVAPDGTTTADRVQTPVVTAGQYSLRTQNVSGATRVGSFFVKGNASSGTAHLMQAGGTVTCVACAYNPSTWTRCVTSGTSTNQTVVNVGVDPLDCGGGGLGAEDFFVWGAQTEISNIATSYIKTVAAAVSRDNDLGTFPAPSGITAAGSVAATRVGDVGLAGNEVYQYLLGSNGAAQFYGFFSASTKTAIDDGTNQAFGNSVYTSAPARFSAFWGTGIHTIGPDGAQYDNATFTGSMSFGSGTLRVGTNAASLYANGVIKQLCLDPSPSRCR